MFISIILDSFQYIKFQFYLTMFQVLMKLHRTMETEPRCRVKNNTCRTLHLASLHCKGASEAVWFPAEKSAANTRRQRHVWRRLEVT